MPSRYIVAGFSEELRRGESRIVYDGPDRLEGEKALQNGTFKSGGYIQNPVWTPLNVKQSTHNETEVSRTADPSTARGVHKRRSA